MAFRFETMFDRGIDPETGRLGPSAVYRHALGRTAWPAKMGVLAAAVVGVLPLLLIVLAALTAGVLVYVICRGLAGVGAFFTGLGSGRAADDGASVSDPLRENVRVVSRG